MPENLVDRLRERQVELRRRTHAGAGRRQRDHHRRVRRREPAHLRRSADRLPRAGRYRDLNGSRDRLAPQRDRALGLRQRMRPRELARPSRDRAHRLVEAHPHGRARPDRKPTLLHVRHRRAQRQMLRALATQRPAEPSRPADLHGDRHLLARVQPPQRRQAPAFDGHRDSPPACAERLDALDAPAERLHADARQCRRVARQRHARPQQDHGPGYDQQRGGTGERPQQPAHSAT